VTGNGALNSDRAKRVTSDEVAAGRAWQACEFIAAEIDLE
jgi:hypothetical protein